MACNQYDTVGDVSAFKGISEFTGEETWFVAACDAVRSMSLDELDEAFALGVLDASTLVWTEGMEGWAPLGTVAGLGSESDLSAERAPDLEDEEDTQRMTHEASFDSVPPSAMTGGPLPPHASLTADGTCSGPSCAPVAQDDDETVFVRHGTSGTRWLLAATAVLGITGTLGMSFAHQVRDRSLAETARLEEAAQKRLGAPSSALAPRYPTRNESHIEREANLFSEPEGGQRLEQRGSLPRRGVHPHRSSRGLSERGSRRPL